MYSYKVSIDAKVKFQLPKGSLQKKLLILGHCPTNFFKLRGGASRTSHVGRSVGPSVGPSVGRSVRRSVGPSVPGKF